MRLLFTGLVFVVFTFIGFSLRYAYSKYQISSYPGIPWSTAMFGLEGILVGLILGFVTAYLAHSRTKQSSSKQICIASVVVTTGVAIWCLGLRAAVTWIQSTDTNAAKSAITNPSTPVGPLE